MDIQHRFSIEVQNRFSLLCSDDTSSDHTYNAMVEASMQAAKVCLPKKKIMRKRVPWEDQNVHQKREELRTIARTKRQHPTDENVVKFKGAVTALDTAYDISQEEYKYIALQH